MGYEELIQGWWIDTLIDLNYSTARFNLCDAEVMFMCNRMKLEEISNCIEFVSNLATDAVLQGLYSSKNPGGQTVNPNSISKLKNGDALKQKYSRHIFSQKHIDGGIMKLGKTEDAIMDVGLEKIELALRKGSVTSGSNQIQTIINGIPTEIRFYVINGDVASFDMFVGHSVVDLGNIIILP